MSENINLYGVYHEYDEDGGFGDAVRIERLIAVFKSEELAEQYCKKWDRTHVYRKPYDWLECGTLTYGKLPDLFGEEDMDTNPWGVDDEDFTPYS